MTARALDLCIAALTAQAVTLDQLAGRSRDAVVASGVRNLALDVREARAVLRRHRRSPAHRSVPVALSRPELDALLGSLGAPDLGVRLRLARVARLFVRLHSFALRASEGAPTDEAGGFRLIAGASLEAAKGAGRILAYARGRGSAA